VCGGKRFNEATLRVRYKGKNVAELLDMSVREAMELFSSCTATSCGRSCDAGRRRGCRT
jgi:excinuclease UvrABC ATPase subunit